MLSQKILNLTLTKIVSLTLIFGLISCESQNVISSIEKADKEPVAQLSLPEYPALALHIIYREFVNQNPNISTIKELNKSSYIEYVEKRLIDLYPEEAYVGMLEENISDYRNWEQEIKLDRKKVLADEENLELENILSPEQEFELLQMTDEEISLWNDIENAINSSPNLILKKGDINSFTNSSIGLSKQRGSESWLGALLVAAAVVYGPGIYRIWLSAKRAEEREVHYFGRAKQDTKSNAFKHMFVCVELRQYLGFGAAHSIMTYREQSTLYSSPRAGLMDLHNNAVGYLFKFDDFNGHWLWDRWSWKKWAKNVYNYADKSYNGIWISKWATTTTEPTYNEAKAEYDRVMQNFSGFPLKKYIHFKNL